MVKTPTVASYLAAQPASHRTVLAKVRAVIRAALPDAEEAISYAIPTYKVDGAAVLYFAGWKKHYAVYPVSAAIKAKLGDALAPYLAPKDTLHMSYDAPVPARLITRVAKLRRKEIA